MTFSISRVAASLAGYLAPSFPGVTFYEDPNQQGSEPPMMFLQQRQGTHHQLMRWSATFGHAILIVDLSRTVQR